MCTCVCVCQRSAVCVGSHRVNCESRLVTAGPAAGVERGWVGVLVLHGKPRFQLNHGLTLIPAPNTDTHEAERRGRQRLARGRLHRPPCNLPHPILQVRRQGWSRNININEPCQGPWAPGKHPSMCYCKMDYIHSSIVICGLQKIITLQTLAHTICSISLHGALTKQTPSEWVSHLELMW